jgi:hypothetical protein
MAVIAFSTAAAIAGSVAWFTASRTVTINAGSYAVVKTSANLEVTLANGVGTSVNENTVTFNGKLTDGSFNHLQGNIYEPNAAGDAIAEEIALTDAQLATKLERAEIGDPAVKVYTAATFKMTFSMTFGADYATAKKVGLFLNNAAGKSAFTVSGTPVTATGFRMGFYTTTTNAEKKVFADLQTNDQSASEGPTDVCKYVASTENFAGTAYNANGAHDLIDATYSEAMPESKSLSISAAQARPDFLGYFTPDDDAVKMEFTVVAWFEGTDPNIVNQDVAANYQEVASNLVFEAIDLSE